MTRHPLLALAALLLPLSAMAENDTPWLPIPGELTLGLSHTTQTGKNASIGNTLLPISGITGGAATEFKRSTTQLRLGYGISDSLAIDGTLGSGKVEVGAADNDKGQTDSVFGLSWRVLDEYASPGLPTLTLRGALIVKGSYDGARLAALGNAADGVEVSVLLGKQLTTSIALWAQVGVQDRKGEVPTASFVDLGARWQFAPGWSASLGYGDKRYGGDLDIGGPGFSPARFQQVRAQRSLLRAGVGFAFAGNQGVALNLAKAQGDGRNAVKDDSVVSLSYAIAF
jgi:hypothetical protein